MLISGKVNIPSGVSEVEITFPLTFDAIPESVLAELHYAGTGTPHVIGVMTAEHAVNGFTCLLTAPAPDGDYWIQWDAEGAWSAGYGDLSPEKQVSYLPGYMPSTSPKHAAIVQADDDGSLTVTLALTRVTTVAGIRVYTPGDLEEPVFIADEDEGHYEQDGVILSLTFPAGAIPVGHYRMEICGAKKLETVYVCREHSLCDA